MKTKINMKCTLYKLLFRVLPVNAWKVFIMDTHFARCPRCLEEVETDETMRELPVSLKEAQTLPSIWLSVSRKMEDRKIEEPAATNRKVWQWSISAAAVGVVLLLLVFFPFSGGDKPGIEEEGLSAADQVVIKSVKIGSEAAKFYVFQSKNPDKLIVWTQKKMNNNGG